VKLRDDEFVKEFPSDPADLPASLREGLYDQDACANLVTAPADMASKYFVPLRGKARR